MVQDMAIVTIEH